MRPRQITRQIKGIVNLDGRLMPLRQAKISVLDHGFLYGDSVYETFRTISGYPFQLKAHLDRLFRSAKQLQLKPLYSKKQMSVQILKTVMAYWKQYGRTDLYIRVIVSRGYGDIGFDPTLCPRPTLVILTKKFIAAPQTYYQRGIHVALVPTIRNNPKSIDPNIKSGNYLNNILAYQEAKKRNADDAIMQNYKGHLTEGTTSNLFIIKKGVLFTPAIKCGLLKGLTRTLIIQMAKAERFTVRQTIIRKNQLFHADECFISGSLKSILPVTRCNSKKIGSGRPGPVTLTLMQLFKKAVQQSVREEYCIDI